MGFNLQSLRVGSKITNKRHIHGTSVRGWKYGAECANTFGTLMPRMIFEVVEVSTNPLDRWLRIKIPNSDPPAHLKVTGGEAANLFEVVVF